MNYNKVLLVALIVLIAAFVAYYVAKPNQISQDRSYLTHEEEGSKRELSVDGSLFTVLVKQSDIQVDVDTKTITYSNADFQLKPELMDLYYKIGLLDQPHNSVVIYPIFTEAAYSEGGFYDFYKNKCDTKCLTVKIPTQFEGEYSASRAAFNALRLLGYQYITDIDVDKNPEILENYDKVILLHNEYVTKREFDSIIQHPKVIYLYPNALYAEIATNYADGTITLVRGHNYPTPEIKNGFNWKFDNTDLEYDNACENWRFYEIDNGIMLNCYPEYIIFKDPILLKKIKDY